MLALLYYNTGFCSPWYCHSWPYWLEKSWEHWIWCICNGLQCWAEKNHKRGTVAIVYLTLGACARVTVVFLVCLFSVCVYYRASCYILFVRWKSGAIRLSVLISTYYVLCGFHWKCFVQKLWQHLLITSAFFTSWLAFNGQKRQRWLIFKKTSVWD